MKLLLLFGGSAALSYLLNNILIRFSGRLGSLYGNSTDLKQIRWASSSKPLVGGISFFLIFLISSLLMDLFHPQKNDDVASGIVPLLCAGVMGFLVGLADDAYTTKPFLKFLGQVASGVILLLFDIQIELFGTPWLDWPLTLFWVIGIMNSINMLDNMDGVTGTVSAGILSVALAVMTITGQTDSILFLSVLAMVGGLIGFLILNWNPSKLYMGDTGSQFLGVFLAYVGIRVFWNHPAEVGQESFFRPIAFGVLTFIMPIMDTSFVTIARLWRGQSPAVGGRDHTTHHLSYLGLPDKVIPVVVGSVTVLSGLMGTAVVLYANTWTWIQSALCLGYAVTLVGVFAMLYLRGGQLQALRLSQKAAAERREHVPAKPAEPVLEHVSVR